MRQAVHELQDVLGPGWGRLFHAERHHLTLRGDGLSVDALSLGLAAAPDLETLRLFQKDLLEDLAGLDPAFDRWLKEERCRLSRAAVSLGESILAEQRGTPGILEAAEHLLLIDRGHEGAWRAVIRSRAEDGDRPAARLAYDRCRATLAELGHGGPSPETEDLLVRIGGQASYAATVDEPMQTVRGTLLSGGGLPGRGLSGGGVSGGGSSVRLGVLPLRAVDPAHPGHADGLAVGLAEEITTLLARFRWISCISGSSLTAISGDGGPGALPWEGMNVDFMLDGTLQRSGANVRILVRIIDMRSGGAVIWARRFDRDATDTLALQDDLAAEIVAQVDPELLMREGERNRGSRTPSPSPNELVLCAIPAIYRLERSGFQAAGKMLADALMADPKHASAHAWYAYWHLFLIGQGWADDPVNASMRAEELAERAVILDPSDARALTLAGHVRSFLGRAREASALHDRAIALNPNLALAWCFSGLALSYLGQHDDALIRLRQASRMSPSDPHSFFFDMAIVMPHLLLGDYEKAIEFGRRAIQLNPLFSSSYKLYLSALGHLGLEREAEIVSARLLTLEPEFSIANAIERSPITRPQDLARYADGLRLAGLQEQSGRRTEPDVMRRLIDFDCRPQHSRLDAG